jgi:dCTP deaminase
MTLSDKKIIEFRLDDEIVIEPYDERNLATSSYDVRLGEYFYREQEPELDEDIFNIYDPEHVKKVWGECQRAPAASQVLPENFKYGNFFTPQDKVIMLAPGETILAHTNEFIGGRTKVTTMMKARSSIGRSFILVCKCAGWGDVGYINRWTFEISNVSRHYRIPLLVGSRVAQIIFMETGPIIDKNYADTGAYQNTSDLNKLQEEWNPETMLPKVRP